MAIIRVFFVVTVFCAGLIFAQNHPLECKFFKQLGAPGNTSADLMKCFSKIGFSPSDFSDIQPAQTPSMVEGLATAKKYVKKVCEKSDEIADAITCTTNLLDQQCGAFMSAIKALINIDNLDEAMRHLCRQNEVVFDADNISCLMNELKSSAETVLQCQRNFAGLINSTFSDEALTVSKVKVASCRLWKEVDCMDNAITGCSAFMNVERKLNQLLKPKQCSDQNSGNHIEMNLLFVVASLGLGRMYVP